MRNGWMEQFRGYIFAIAATAVALWVRTMLHPILQERLPFGVFYLSVIMSAWLGGTPSAVLAMALGMLAAAHFVIPPESSLLITEPADWVSLLIYAIVGAVTIVTFEKTRCDQRKAEQRSLENQKLTETLKRSDLQKDEYLALLAHELRNPLAPIATSVDLMARCRDDARRFDTLRRAVLRQLSQLVRIVDDLLDVSRYLQGKMRLLRDPFDFREAVGAAVEMVQPQIDEQGHDVRLLIPDVPFGVNGDRVRLVQVVSNLLSNSAKYTPRGGRICIDLRAENGVAVLAVSDNGIGIAEDDRKRIFEAFAQVDSSHTRDHGGLGLGLALVKQLCELHDGTVDVVSRGPGKGSRFEVRLPMVELPTPTVRVVERQEPIDLESMSVMIVDDNRDAAETLSMLLTFEGMSTTVAYDGPMAIDLLRKQKPAFILLDIGLPGMDGYEVARRIRADHGQDGVKIIALTGWGGPEDRRRTKEAGFDDHVVKPVDPANLVALLRGAQPQSA
ncbi:response regulator [Blastopirellula sp. JC732]|uniref:histidine kinase n=1 Tax=Blastopirellula sediminis TaxID=2894196 RepID=A0A9X1MRB1_9BACT|nr:ATP-binding protein [Blastopirellula sediminis]MCC9605740.1 response regulator [Blastopirellula sediminis]MCC9630960.1 response regulator [Blastopirellula sediminis]